METSRRIGFVSNWTLSARFLVLFCPSMMIIKKSLRGQFLAIGLTAATECFSLPWWMIPGAISAWTVLYSISKLAERLSVPTGKWLWLKAVIGFLLQRSILYWTNPLNRNLLSFWCRVWRLETARLRVPVSFGYINRRTKLGWYSFLWRSLATEIKDYFNVCKNVQY